MSAVTDALARLGVTETPVGVMVGSQWSVGRGESCEVRSPVDGSRLASLTMATADDVRSAVTAAQRAFLVWRSIPAPRRGEFVRKIGERLRVHKSDLATLVTWEAGKIRQEALGEVQEMIDICDFAVGQSRQLYGLTIASERPLHRLAEQYHPLGPVGVISAFNFPVAVWAWNAMLALVCGDPVIWKPSEKTPLCAIGCQAVIRQVLEDSSDVPSAISSVLIGQAVIGQAIASAPGIPLVSATGSVPMGRAVGQTIAARLGRSLLELGGNNAMIVAPSADLELALRGIVFAAVGTCGQRCTTLRRLIVHQSIADSLLESLKKSYASLVIGHPAQAGVLVGPLIDRRAWESMVSALSAARLQGGRVFGGERLVSGVPEGGHYVRPAIVEIDADATIVQQETFAPILYVMRYDSLSQAIAMQNDVPQGLASSIFTNDVREAELFCSAVGSDCGIVNVNIGTSGAEIGGAFGGEKETGGGRESGSDAWKVYMRRVTNTVNYSSDLPLAQGIRFDL